MEGVTACVSAFFVDRGSYGVSDGNDNGRVNAKLFACAALDLLMVLHARLPSGCCGGRDNPSGLSEPAANAVHPEAIAVAEDGKVLASPEASVETLSVGASPRALEGEADSAKNNRVDGDGDSGRSIEGLDAWMVILRALSLGGRSRHEEIGMHSLQLLTKVSFAGNRHSVPSIDQALPPPFFSHFSTVKNIGQKHLMYTPFYFILDMYLNVFPIVHQAVLDNQAREAPPEVLREVLLTVVLPLGAHVWRQEGQVMALKSQRRGRHRQGKSSRIESGRGGGGGGGGSRGREKAFRGGDFSGVGDSELRRDSRGEARCRSSTPCSEKRRDVLHQESRDGRMSPGSASSRVGARHGLHQFKGDVVVPKSGPQAFQGGTEGATDDRGGRDNSGDGDLNVNAAEMTEEGFELVEAPDFELSPDRESSEHNASTNTLAAGDGVERGEGGLVIRRQFSSEGSSYEEAGAGGFEEDKGTSPTRKGDEDGVQLSSPALLALLLVFKSFLMHLPSLRLAGDFHEVWNQVGVRSLNSERVASMMMFTGNPRSNENEPHRMNHMTTSFTNFRTQIASRDT